MPRDLGATKGEAVLAVWESLSGRRLDDAQRAAFLGRREIHELSRYSIAFLVEAAQEVEHHDRLRLDEWLQAIHVTEERWDTEARQAIPSDEELLPPEPRRRRSTR